MNEDGIRKITHDSVRAITRRPRVGKALDKLNMMDADLKNAKIYGGFGYQADNMIPEIEKGRVTSPAAVIVTCSTFYGVVLLQCDFFEGGLTTSKPMFALDDNMGTYENTGTGTNSKVAFLLDGQSEATIIDNFPYINTFPTADIIRTGSPYGFAPGAPVPPWHVNIYPDDWPHVSVFPQPIDNVWLSYCGMDFFHGEPEGAYDLTNSETTLLKLYGDNRVIGGRRTFLEQEWWVGGFRPTATSYPLPVTGGMRMMRPVEFLYYPFSDGKRYYATIVQKQDGLFEYDRVNMEDILPVAGTVTHTGDFMPTTLRNIVLNDNNASARCHGFYCFTTEPGRKPIILNVIDITDTDNPRNPGGDDDDYLHNNPTERDWKLSVHWNDTETGETWTYTAAQFWSLLESKQTQVVLGANWQTADEYYTGQPASGWAAARLMLWQFFGRPNRAFSVPHDTHMFHAEDGNVYTWTRNYGTVQFTRLGLFDYPSFYVPAICTSTDGVRPTIRYSGNGRYVCLCEDLSEVKEVSEVYIGTPFVVDSWTQIAELPVEETGILSHVRVAYHNYDTESGVESLLLLGIIRRTEIIDEVEEIVYFLANFSYNSTRSDNDWKVTARLTGIDTIDPAYDGNPAYADGERVSWDISLFGDQRLSPKMMRYLSPPPGFSQMSCISPYSNYSTGLP